MKKLEPNCKVMLSIDPYLGDLIYTNISNGIPIKLTEDDKKSLSLILSKENKNDGRIFIMNFNPVHNNGNLNIIFNLINLLMTDQMYLTM